jgi:putative hemin transport protein
MSITELKAAWAALKEKQPKLRIKNAAEQLGVSELELVQTLENATPLKSDWPGIFSEIENLGYVMALTRNESVVHERKGEYHNISFKGHVGLVLDPNIDLRIFPGRINYAFAVPVQNPRGTLLSLQFFDKYGCAVHKVYLMNQDNAEAYHTLVEKFKNNDAPENLEVERGERPSDFEEAADFDREALLEDWKNLKDTHDFYPMLRKHKAKRTEALRAAEGSFTQKLDNTATERMLNGASQKQVPIMVFVSSGAVIQIHTGEVSTIKKMDTWLNVLDPEFNLHLREDHITDTWIVEKPTEDGIVTSLEIFDAKGQNIATFFGARKPGKPELQSWRDLIDSIKTEQVSA